MNLKYLTGQGQSRKMRGILLLILFLALVTFLMYTNLAVPSTKSISGIYRNECCAYIRIDDGHLIYAGKSYEFRLLTEKQGLTGYVGGRFTRSVIEPSAEPTLIGVSNDGGRRSLSIRMDQHDYTFRLVQSSSNPQLRRISQP